MLGKWRISKRLKEIDAKLMSDDEIVRHLSDVVLQLRVVTKQTEMILRELKKDEAFMEDDDGQYS